MRSDGSEILRLSAFSVGGRGGNPAGVVLGAERLSATERLAIAADLGYSESAFLESMGGHRYRIQYFSPRAEVPFCGHATIAAAVVVAGRHGTGGYVFESAVGPIQLTTTVAKDDSVIATLTSVATTTRPTTETELDELLAALRLQPADLNPRYPPHVAFAGNDHPILVLSGRDRLAALDYDYPALAELMDRASWITVDLLWAASATEFHARNPFPPGGVVEDPATGAAAAAFGGYLRSLGFVTAPGRVLVFQGEDMGRPSRLDISLVPGEPGVLVSGTATVLD